MPAALFSLARATGLIAQDHRRGRFDSEREGQGLQPSRALVDRLRETRVRSSRPGQLRCGWNADVVDGSQRFAPLN